MYRCTHCARVFVGPITGTNRTILHLRSAPIGRTIRPATHWSSLCAPNAESLHIGRWPNFRRGLSISDSSRRCFARCSTQSHPVPQPVAHPVEHVNRVATTPSSPSRRSKTRISRHCTTSFMHCVPTGCKRRLLRCAATGNRALPFFWIHSESARWTCFGKCRPPQRLPCTSIVPAKPSPALALGTSTA